MTELAIPIIVYVFALLVLLASGVWVGLAMLGVGALGMTVFTPHLIGDVMATTIWSALASWPLLALPLFVWMGEIMVRSNLSNQLFAGLGPLVRQLPGRLLHVNVVGSTMFAAICGSSAATVATVGKISLPELRQRGYPEGISVGTLAGAGTLGLLMPPSIIMIVYGVAVNESIVKLFVAGLIPAFVLATLFSGYVVFWSLVADSGRVPRDPDTRPVRPLACVRRLLPAAILIFGVLGSIYTGALTATEAAVLGVFGALAISCADGSLNARLFVESLSGALKTSCMIGLILAGSAFVTLAMGFTGLPRTLAEYIGSLGLSAPTLLLSLAVFYLLLGMFLDGISAIVLTMAVVEPIIRQSGIDTIWFGVFLVVLVEAAQITPPVGFNLFVLQGMSGMDLLRIARSSCPFFALMILMLLLLWACPQLALYLPAQM